MDIRTKPTLSNNDILNLNFIRQPCPYYFRIHYREGLRSRLLQVLNLEDVLHETQGVVQGGMRLFPVAQPVAMLRIFKKQFNAGHEVQTEIQNYKLVQHHILPQHYAASSEFVVEYIQNGNSQIMLCGLQKYVPGEAVDPWHENTRLKIENDMENSPTGNLEMALSNLTSFINCIKTMALQTQTIPDLAGVGNLILTPEAEIKLVDINNISRFSFATSIPLDDKQYPVSDKSIQALYNLEIQIIGNDQAKNEELYRFFLDPQRQAAVRELEIAFLKNTAQSANYPAVKIN
jgi:hypothetical protein